ncbi:MAG: acyl-CoA dehydrogenase domain protein [Mycobacterium sp.]|nr:acyl-CoA dehydrogenase domain protein [Mycobacterium sp.]
MSIAITDDHRVLADTVADFLSKNDALGANRALLEAQNDTLPPFWKSMADLGWLGLHLPEDHGGSGFGLPELAVVVEELGRAVVPGPFVPTVIASAVIARAGAPDLQARLLPGLADGSTVGAVALGGVVTVDGGVVSGDAGVVIGASLADVFLVPVGDDVAVIEAGLGGVTVEVPANMDPSRRAGRVALNGAKATIMTGARSVLLDRSRLLFAAEATGIARECTTQAAEYAKMREQFGRPIATFQAVKHHCANMLVATELATAAVWDAARAADDGDQSSYTAAIAAVLALPAAAANAQLNIQVHGGIGFTWEHDAHLFVRRIAAIAALLGVEAAAEAVTDLIRGGVRRANAVDLPAEAAPVREEVRAFVEEVKQLDDDCKRAALIEAGYAVPHWPRPFGRDAGAIEQLVIEKEFSEAGIKRPVYGITGWVILTLIQHATDEQVARWVSPALHQDVIWCQLFSEPAAGSDAAGVKTKATRVEGGWLVNGQKVWTSGAQVASFGLATVRTDPDAPKHAGITTMVIDMHGPGVEVRPLRMPTGHSEFNEVFFDDVFVPDDDVVGPINGGWTVARATLGNESVSIGGGQGGAANAEGTLVEMFDAHPDRLAGGSGRLGRYLASAQTMGVLNLRTASRAVVGAGPGPEGAVTKLVSTEVGHEASAILTELAGPDAAFLDGPGMMPGFMLFMNRGMAIAGGTSEIKRNQIGERILGLPRDPLIK